MSEAPLTYRVLNLGRGVAAAYASRLLADLGAGVSWWRWDQGDDREWPRDDSLFRSWFERGVELHVEEAPPSAIVARAAGVATAFDLVITDFTVNEQTPGAVLTALSRVNPRVVVANADHFGRTGPYAAWNGDEVTDYALGGYWAIAGDPDRAPLRVPGFQAQFHNGMQLALAAMAALRYADTTGHGQEVETSAAEAMLGAHWSTTIAWTHEGRVLKRLGGDLFPATDGWAFFYRMGMYQNILLLIDRPDLLDDERFSTIQNWLANGETLWGMVGEWCATRTVEEIVQTAQELRIPVTPLNTADRLLEDGVLQEREFYVEVDGKKVPGLPYRWNDRWEAKPAPTTLSDSLSADKPPVVAPISPANLGTPVNSDGPLAGLLVLELTNNWAGPIAGRHMADLGAEIIKIELPTKPATRASHYPGKEPGLDHWNRSGYFNEMNRNKRGLALNLATDRGKELFLELVQKADVIVENNSARVMPNLGLGYERLREVNPRIVMASISGFGATGDRKDWVAFGSNIEAACGLAAINGYAGGDPQRTGSFVPDPIAGAHAVIGILAALARRDRTGEGAHLDISLTESALPFMLEAFTYYHNHGELRPRMGNRDPWDAPVGAYRSYGIDDWIAIAVRSDEEWANLCAVTAIDRTLGSTREARLANHDAIDEALEVWTRQRPQYAAVEALQAAGVVAAPILHNWQLHSDRHFAVRNSFVEIDHPSTGVYPYPNAPWHLSRTPASIRQAAPRFAEGNDYVFRSMLGLSEAEVAELYELSVTGNEPIGLTAVVV